MAVQRYLATRDARSARRMFGISLCCDALVFTLLAALGLALFAYFQARPEMLPENKTVLTAADGLLLHYIVNSLPVGISGLVVAGLIAAAMSSLSSGLNSSCSVITVDWIDRFRTAKLGEAEHVQMARAVSWVVGLVIVLLSFTPDLVHGNLLEATNKLVNLLTAPLFVLFFMSMFVPWATTFGAWIAELASIAAAVVIAYTNLTGLSFLWIMPGALVTGILSGCIASLLPIGPKCPMLGLQTSQAAAAE
jgi:SSS family solute:Na+ symporter